MTGTANYLTLYIFAVGQVVMFQTNAVPTLCADSRRWIDVHGSFLSCCMVRRLGGCRPPLAKLLTVCRHQNWWIGGLFFSCRTHGRGDARRCPQALGREAGAGRTRRGTPGKGRHARLFHCKLAQDQNTLRRQFGNGCSASPPAPRSKGGCCGGKSPHSPVGNV